MQKSLYELNHHGHGLSWKLTVCPPPTLTNFTFSLLVIRALQFYCHLVSEYDQKFLKCFEISWKICFPVLLFFRQNFLKPVNFLENHISVVYTQLFRINWMAKLLFHQSPTRHSVYMVTGQWQCSHCWLTAGSMVPELPMSSHCAASN